MSSIHGGFGGALFANTFAGGGAIGGRVKGGEVMAVKGCGYINSNTLLRQNP